MGQLRLTIDTVYYLDITFEKNDYLVPNFITFFFFNKLTITRKHNIHL